MTLNRHSIEIIVLILQEKKRRISFFYFNTLSRVNYGSIVKFSVSFANIQKQRTYV